jgi:inhibitor of nuclear factor kappa-B kinase subunit alpha
MDEKIFTFEQQYNCQNDDLCSNILWDEGEVSKGAQRPSLFLHHGFVGVSLQGVTFLHFCNKVKTGARVYQEDFLQGVVKPPNTALFNGQKWIFQQEPAPAYKAKTTQECCGDTFS